MKIALTGATGFVGQHLLRGLLQQGHTVTALIRNPNKLSGDLLSHERLKLIHGSLDNYPNNWLDGVDCVIHLAGLIKARRRADYMAINAKAAANLAQLAEQKQVKRFILLSSMAARQAQLSDYAASKLAGEQAVRKAYKDGRLAIIRAPAIFGPKDAATKPIFSWLNKGFLIVPGRNWKNVRLSMTYIDDLVSAIMDKALSGAYDGDIISPATIGSMSWQDFAEYSHAALGKKIKILAIAQIFIVPIAAISGLCLRLFGKGHLSLGKLREFQHPDWTSSDEVDNPISMVSALQITAASYGLQSDKSTR